MSWKSLGKKIFEFWECYYRDRGLDFVMAGLVSDHLQRDPYFRVVVKHKTGIHEIHIALERKSDLDIQREVAEHFDRIIGLTEHEPEKSFVIRVSWP